MTAALTGSIEGLQTVLCEKTAMVGGTTSTSAGTVWIPGSSQSVAAGVPDRLDDARQYLNSVIGPEGQAERDAFLRTGPAVLDYLEAQTEVKFLAAKAHPDYLGNHPGAAYGGRALSAPSFDGRKLGEDFRRVRPPRPEFVIFGGMMVAKADIPFLLRPFASLKAFAHVLRMVLRYAVDRLGYSRGTHLVMGNALVGRLLYSLKQRNVPIRYETSLVDLVIENGAVIGAVIAGPNGRRSVGCRKGAILATGGVGWNQRLRADLFPSQGREHSLSLETNSADGIEAALRSGGTLDKPLASAALWMPSSILTRPDGTRSVFPHIVLDRAKPGLIAVNKSGRRFANEANSYHDFVLGMLDADHETPSIPAYLLCDRSFIRDYGLGLVHPGTRNLKPFIKAQYLIEAHSLSELAQRIGAVPDVLQRTVASHNRFAQTGIDEEFGRGSTDLNRINGDPDNKPNPCLRPIGPGPFFAVAVWPADLASSAGIGTDGAGRVLRDDGSAISGLYACGNDAASIFRGTYPGPGTTIGPGMVFAWRAVMDAKVRKVGPEVI